MPSHFPTGSLFMGKILSQACPIHSIDSYDAMIDCDDAGWRYLEWWGKRSLSPDSKLGNLEGRKFWYCGRALRPNCGMKKIPNEGRIVEQNTSQLCATKCFLGDTPLFHSSRRKSGQVCNRYRKLSHFLPAISLTALITISSMGSPHKPGRP